MMLPALEEKSRRNAFEHCWRIMDTRCFAIIVALSSSTAQAFGQEIKFSDLEGYSISIEYVEGVSNNGGSSTPYLWNDAIYISTKGRIFHSSKQKSALRTSDYSRETVGELVGADFAQTGQFRWTGQGIVREWLRPGLRIRYSVMITRSRAGFTCRASIERFGNSVKTHQIREKCHVKKGNIHG